MRIDSLQEAVPATAVEWTASHISGFAQVRRALSAWLARAADQRAARRMADARIMRDIGLPPDDRS